MSQQVSDDELLNNVLANQIPDIDLEKQNEDPNRPSFLDEPISNEPVLDNNAPSNNSVEQKEQIIEDGNKENLPPFNPLAGKKLSYVPGSRESLISDEEKRESLKYIEEHHITKTGENIFKNAELREGWIPVDRGIMGLRSYFYPEDWQFRIRPANVEAIRNWSNVDENNPLALDDVLNEVLKSCLSIVTSQGQIPWGNINSWDRFYFLLLIREYTFVNGESKLSYEEDCPECDNPVQFELTSSSIMYEFPDEDIIQYYNVNKRCWEIDPKEYDVEANPIRLFVPTVSNDANIKAWYIDRLQNNPNKKTDQTFLRFLPWLSPKISKDIDIAKKQIKSLENEYKSWDIEMFTFMDEVLKNIQVVPKDKLITKCPICGEEVTAQIRFPNSVRDLFNVPNKHRKFGKK